MLRSSEHPSRGPCRAAFLSALTLLCTVAGARAQAVTEEQILAALSPRPLTRGLTLGVRGDAGSEGRAFLDTLRNRTGLSDTERERLAAAAADRPSIDLDVPFAYNSAQIGPKALPVVKVLGATLSRPQMSGSVILIVGHTDANGSDHGNQVLSERRAEAVKQYIVHNYGVPAANLVAVGYGKRHLKDAARPTAPENRRVTAVNMSAVKSASRE
ncbi:OmpA/MotB domain protein [Methylobacterium sp. 4-46]|uniref:OmpA family protein n=1 Tax=unclassified Methylobacterium TaxID=2615210 RepID=UPI000152C7EA|nr:MULTISPECIES: OmpA family protein [Methylobacterium]ACA15389.1 OmpA/MotB domain protein [Methylobacterium sp. 4-46]WFT81110.1 OmpA family protein [Methylobacterium nodulans]